jgi:hypothetical protein
MAPSSKMPTCDPADERLLELLENLFLTAKVMPTGPSGRGFRFQKGGDPSVEAVRDALGWQTRWTFWRNGTWPGGDGIGRQRNLTRELIDFCSGRFEDKHFGENPGRYGTRRTYRAAAIDIQGYLLAKRPDDLAAALARLDTYSTKLDKRAKEQLEKTQELARERQASKIDLAGDTVQRSDLFYIGRQSEHSTDEQTAAIQQVFRRALENSDRNSIPLTLSSFDFEHRPYTRGPAILDQKFALYGGIPRVPLKISPFGYVTSGLTFERNQAGSIYSDIVGVSSDFSSHTVLAHPGQGKSIALAQILLRICKTPGYWAFWSFDNKKPFSCEADRRCIEKFIALFRKAGYLPRRLLFVFDDLHRRKLADYTAILDFHSWCEDYSRAEHVGISFLCSSTEQEYGMSPDHCVRLHLESADENNLYSALTEHHPIIVNKAHNSLDDMLAVYPVEHPWKDDVQSLADYIIQHSMPTRDFVPNWFSDLKDETSIAQNILPVIAVSQLLDLDLPDHIAHKIADLDSDITRSSTAPLTAISDRIGHEGAASSEHADPWSGYKLKSPYYAGSLLRRVKKFEGSFVKETFVRVLSISLGRAEHELALWNVTDAEFLRHVFQRLAKRKFNRLASFADGTHIAKELFIQHAPKICEIVRNQQLALNCASWAGTFAYLIPEIPQGRFSSENHSVERIVYDLCSHVIRKTPFIDDSQDFVPLMWAIRALCTQYKDEPHVLDLANAAEHMLDVDNVFRAVIMDRNPGSERRGNEVILSYVKFLMAIPGRPKKDTSATVLKFYETIDKYERFQLDALNFLQRSEAVWIRGERDVALRAKYLRRAQEAVCTRKRAQGKWRSLVDRQVAMFRERHGRDVDDFADGVGGQPAKSQGGEA